MSEEVRYGSEVHQVGEVIKRKRKKKVKLGFNWFFWTCCLIIAIPCVYFVVLLYQAAQVSNVPINGDRLKNSIKYEINDSQLESVISAVKAVDGVENCSGTLIVAQLRFTIDAENNLTNDQYKEILEKCYETITEQLPEEQYFTLIDDYKQYDIQINLYDDVKKDDPVMITLIRNSSMEGHKIEVYSEARNEKAKSDAIAEITETEEETETEESDE